MLCSAGHPADSVLPASAPSSSVVSVPVAVVTNPGVCPSDAHAKIVIPVLLPVAAPPVSAGASCSIDRGVDLIGWADERTPFDNNYDSSFFAVARVRVPYVIIIIALLVSRAPLVSTAAAELPAPVGTVLAVFVFTVGRTVGIR